MLSSWHSKKKTQSRTVAGKKFKHESASFMTNDVKKDLPRSSTRDVEWEPDVNSDDYEYASSG